MRFSVERVREQLKGEAGLSAQREATDEKDIDVGFPAAQHGEIPMRTFK